MKTLVGLDSPRVLAKARTRGENREVNSSDRSSKENRVKGWTRDVQEKGFSSLPRWLKGVDSVSDTKITCFLKSSGELKSSSP